MSDDKLKKIDEEDIVLVIFIGLFLLKLLSNMVEREYRISGRDDKRRMYHYINIFTFIVALIISLYYIYITLGEEEWDYLVLLANVLTVLTIFILIYKEVVSDD